MPAYDMTGTVKVIMDQQTFESGFTKREFVVTTDDDRYPQDIKFECVKDKCALLDEVKNRAARDGHIRSERQRVQRPILCKPYSMARRFSW